MPPRSFCCAGDSSQSGSMGGQRARTLDAPTLSAMCLVCGRCLVSIFSKPVYPLSENSLDTFLSLTLAELLLPANNALGPFHFFKSLRTKTKLPEILQNPVLLTINTLRKHASVDIDLISFIRAKLTKLHLGQNHLWELPEVSRQR